MEGKRELDMDNLKSTIYIINIGAEKLGNPNWNLDMKKLKIKNELDEILMDIDIYLYDSNNPELSEKERIQNKNFYDYITRNAAPLQKSLDSLNDPDIRTDIYKITEEKRDLLYSGSLPVSLDILKLKRLFPNELYSIDKKSGKHKKYNGDIFNKIENEKLYTDAIINVTFDKASYEVVDKMLFFNSKWNNDMTDVKGKKITRARTLRKKFYDEGVTLRFGDSLVEYVKYKRSSSKAREGSHLFIKKELKEKMSDLDAFGIHYDSKDKNVPLAAIKAYESLTSSGIEKIIKIKPDEILLIDDEKSQVKIKASVTTELENGEIIAEDNDEYEITNVIWDGQSLADISLFADEKSEEQKGMMLLRNSFFKSCGFNTNIQKWFDDKLGDNKKEFILDMFGHKIKRTDIKLITTPSSLKFLKFYDKFSGANPNEKKKIVMKNGLKQYRMNLGFVSMKAPAHSGNFISYPIRL
jgi:hypothetical protein